MTQNRAFLSFVQLVAAVRTFQFLRAKSEKRMLPATKLSSSFFQPRSPPSTNTFILVSPASVKPRLQFHPSQQQIQQQQQAPQHLQPPQPSSPLPSPPASPQQQQQQQGSTSKENVLKKMRFYILLTRFALPVLAFAAVFQVGRLVCLGGLQD